MTSNGAVNIAPDIPPTAPARNGTHVFEGNINPPALGRVEVLTSVDVGGMVGIVSGSMSSVIPDMLEGERTFGGGSGDDG
jgi:hypothetical protein